LKAKDGILDRLNRHLTVELTAINQYFLASEMCADWGYGRLHAKFRELSMEEMQDAQKLVRHILYLEGLPNMQRLGEVRVGENVQEILEAGMQAEINAIAGLQEGITHCLAVQDYTTRAMFEEMIQEEEGHLDWYETQLETIKQVGMERWLTQQMH
jgi:bacterioferritin